MRSHWLAIAPSRSVRARPRRIVAGGRPLVLFRDGDTVFCLEDRCAHRHAPLSGGRVSGGTIECPYHGWRFDRTGRCVAMPGLCGPVPAIAVPRRAVKEKGGLVFLGVGDPAGEPYVSAMDGTDHVRIITESVVEASLADTAENILDATHTHFTHKGLLRGLSRKRTRIRVEIVSADDQAEAIYTGESRQHGLISRLLEAGRTTSVGRFRAPGIAELEFHGANGPNLVTTFHLREERPGLTRGIAVLAGPRQGGLGWIKAALFLPLFKAAYLQDKRILSLSSANRALCGEPVPVTGPLDVLRQEIVAICRGDELPASKRSLVMEL